MEPSWSGLFVDRVFYSSGVTGSKAWYASKSLGHGLFELCAAGWGSGWDQRPAPRPPEDFVTREAPELRIVSDELPEGPPHVSSNPPPTS